MGTVIRCLIAVWSFVAGSLYAQIINAEALRLNAPGPGWAGQARAGVHLRQNTRFLLAVSGALHVQWRKGHHLLLAMAEGQIQQADRADLVRRFVGHLRYNWEGWKRMIPEVFVQVQHNALMGIRRRDLVGAGPRIPMVQHPNFRLFIGPMIMLEREIQTYDQQIDTQQVWRNSTYLALSARTTQGLVFTWVTYFQPVLTHPTDWRFFTDVQIQVPLIARLDMVVKWTWLYDTVPVPTFPRIQYAFHYTLAYRLNGTGKRQ